MHAHKLKARAGNPESRPHGHKGATIRKHLSHSSEKARAHLQQPIGHLMASPNIYPWPSIDHLSKSVPHNIHAALDTCDSAASLIGRAWRTHRGGHSEEARRALAIALSEFAGARRTTPAALRRKFCDAPCTATQKFDGTNVGVTEDGILLGRRLQICPAADTYQKTTLKHVRAATAHCAAIKAAILEAIAPSLSPWAQEVARHQLHLVIYGELMCNAGLYDYAKRGIPGQFKCFGAIFRLKNPEALQAAMVPGARVGEAGAAVAGAAAEFCEELTSAFSKLGLVSGCSAPQEDGHHPQVELMMCAALRVLFGSHELASVPIDHEGGSLTDIVQALEPWMVRGAGEGVVVTLAGESLRKWKTACEPQGTTPDVLAALLARLQASGQSPVVGEGAWVIHPAIVAMVRTMHAVSVSSCEGRAHASQQASTTLKRKGLKQPKAVLVDPIAVAEALQSALTKFDALDALFEQAGTPMSVGNALAKEVVEDLGGSCTDVGSPEGQQVRAIVLKSIGREFGLWKKSKASVVAPTVQ